jgi:hypothetical protein
MAGIKANKRLANIPAVVPLKFRTRAKITIVVRDPIITGNIITKSKSELPKPKILYMVAAMR